MTAEYSGTPLLKKLGIKEHTKLLLLNTPANYFDLLGELPEGLSINEYEADIDLIHFFTTDDVELKEVLPQLKAMIKKNGAIWISWPKKTAKVNTNVDGNLVRTLGKEIGLVDAKVCAVDEIWSGHKFCIRKEER